MYASTVLNSSAWKLFILSFVAHLKSSEYASLKKKETSESLKSAGGLTFTMNIYLDWNVFNQIEKRVSLPADEKQVYLDLYDAIKDGRFHIPYSNAHLNDLIRGYKKNPAYIEGHLTIIEELSQNLCICQYWKQNKPLWHIRSVRDFFNSAIEEKETEWETFDDLLDEKYEISETISLSPL